MGYSIREIASILRLESDSDRIIEHLLIDSRKVLHPNSTLFFALQGAHQDGHSFIPELIAKGVKAFVVSKPVDPDDDDITILQVDHVLDALQHIAAYHRDRFGMPVFAITGSNGKTVVKEWLYQLLHQDHRIVRSPRSYNSQIGVPLSLWQMNDGHEMAIIEAGISEPGEMEILEQMIQPTHGVITNLGEAHAKNFHDPLEKLNEKLDLFESCDTIFYCSDHNLVGQIMKERYPTKNMVGWSVNPGSQLEVRDIDLDSMKVTVRYEGREHVFPLPFSDNGSIENFLHCINIAMHLESNPDELARRAESISPIDMRMQLHRGINGCTLINDSYNSDLPSILNGIEWLSRQTQHEKKVVILSDFETASEDFEKTFNAAIAAMKSAGVKRFIGVGPVISFYNEWVDIEEKHFAASTEEAEKKLMEMRFSDEAILIKGSRKFNLESLVKILQLQSHGTTVEINLGAMGRNLDAFRQKIPQDTKIMCMVKAFSYGTGSYEVAHYLSTKGVDYLAVAYADEGAQLRKAGITLPIMILNPEERSHHLLFKYHLEPEVYSVQVLASLVASYEQSFHSDETSLKIHLNLDTGMHRLGLVEDDLKSISELMDQYPYLEVASIFSHLSSADEQDQHEFTQGQIEQFERLSNQFMSEKSVKPLRHLLNTSGMHRYSDYAFDMVRLGIGLYGSGEDSLESTLEPVVSVKARILQIKNLAKGDSLGYGRSHIASKAQTVATISLGYADGLGRDLGNGHGFVFVNGEKQPILGNVCMDMCMVDVSGMVVNVGDEVIWIGSDQTLGAVAKQMNTIPYEVLTSIPERVKRVYFEE